MASPPPASSSSSSCPLEALFLSDFGDLAPDEIIFCARPNRNGARLLERAKTSFTGSSEQDVAKDGKEDSPSPDEGSKHSHECLTQMNKHTPGLRSSAVSPRRTTVFILDSRATSHVVADVSLFSPSFRSTTTATTPAGSARLRRLLRCLAGERPDRRVLTVPGVGTVSCDNFLIPNVRCVPDLVSVQQLAECGYLAMFGDGQCFVMEQSSGNIVGKGRLHADDGRYYLEFLNIPHDKPCEGTTET